MEIKKKYNLISLLIVFTFLIANLSVVFAEDYSSTNFKSRDPVIDIFGGRSTSTNFEQFNAGGQTVTGESTSPNFILQSGFLYFRPAGTPPSVTSPGSTSFTTKTVSINSQTTTATISPVEVQSGAPGWSTTLTSTHITRISPIQIVYGTNSITTGGTYDGTYGVSDPVKKYGVKIAAGGAVGTATYQWRVDDGTWTTPATTAATVTLEKGIQVNFSGTYTAGDEWLFSVDVFPYTGLTVTPGDITVVSGSGTGVSKGTSQTLTGSSATSNSKTLMSAQPDYGVGTYQQPEDLNLNIRANSLNGNFQGTVTITIL
jgi:hypothetical protein